MVSHVCKDNGTNIEYCREPITVFAAFIVMYACSIRNISTQLWLSQKDHSCIFMLTRAIVISPVVGGLSMCDLLHGFALPRRCPPSCPSYDLAGVRVLWELSSASPISLLLQTGLPTSQHNQTLSRCICLENA